MPAAIDSLIVFLYAVVVVWYVYNYDQGYFDCQLDTEKTPGCWGIVVHRQVSFLREGLNPQISKFE